MKTYITPQGREAIRKFRYKGGSNSYSYEYVWSPLAEFVLKKLTPITLAPNLITLAGLLTLICAWGVIAIQYPIQSKLTSISMIIFAILVLIYQTLDNVDGKQARRTKSSTPLGMLFDHGSDALVSVLLSFSLARVILISNEATLILSCFLCVQLGFYFAVWVQYHANGIMILGKVNGIDDGIPATWMIAVVTSIIGQNFWTSKDFFGIQNYHGLIAFVGVCTTIQSFSLISNTQGQFTKHKFSAISKLFHVPLRVASVLTVIYFTDWYLEGRYFYQIYFSLSLPFVRDIIYMQVCVVTNQKYNQFSTPAIIYILAYPIYILMKEYFGITLMNEWLFVNGLTLYFILQYIHFVIAIIWQISSALGIQVFSIEWVKKKTNNSQHHNPQSSSRSSSEDENLHKLK